MTDSIDELRAALDANLGRLVRVIATQCGFGPAYDVVSNMRTFFEMEAERLYRAWLQTGNLGAQKSYSDQQIGWLLQERAALEAKLMQAAAANQDAAPTLQ